MSMFTIQIQVMKFYKETHSQEKYLKEVTSIEELK